MKHWYDMEFIDDGHTIDLISIGIVAEDGREYYAVSAEFDVEKLFRNPWLVENVWPTLPTYRHTRGRACGWCKRGMGHLDIGTGHPVWARSTIANDVQEFLTVGLEDGAEAELWSWFPSYDHVALAQLWGPMTNLPRGIPKRTNDIEQEAERLGIVGLEPDPPEGQHNALVDAHYHRQLWGFCMDHGAEQRNNLIKAAEDGHYAATRRD